MSDVKLKKTVLLCLSVLLFFSLFSLPLHVSADSEKVHRTVVVSKDGYTGEEDLFSVRADNAKSFGINSGQWELDGAAAEQHIRFNINRSILSVYGVSTAEFERNLTYKQNVSSKNINISNYSSLRFGLCVTGNEAMYRMLVRLRTDEGVLEGEVTVESNSWNLISLDLDNERGWIRDLEVNITVDGGRRVDSVRISTPFVSEIKSVEFEYARRYSSSDLSRESGRINLHTGETKIPDDGFIILSGKLAAEEALKIGTDAFFEIKVDGVSSGNMTLGVLYTGVDEEQRMYGKKISLSPADETYTVHVEVHGNICSFLLQFDNLVGDGDYLNLMEIRVYSGESIRVEADTSLGSLHSLTLKNGGVCFDGVMDRDAAARYSDEKLVFCAVPLWSESWTDGMKILGETKVSTKFTYTADTSSLPYSSDLYLYFVVLRRGDELVPISSPYYPQAGDVQMPQLSSVGVHGASTVGAFESNSSHVIVDVPLYSLLNAGNSSTSDFVYKTDSGEKGENSVSRRVGMNKQILSEIKTEVDFYVSAGIDVYLRLISYGAVKDLTYSQTAYSKSYMPNSSDPESARMYCGLVTALSASFPNIRGFVLGEGVNYREFVGGADFKNPAKYAEELAHLCRITYNASKKYISDVLVVVPFVESRFDGNLSNIWLSDRTLAVMLSKNLGEIGRIPWAFMYSVDSFSDRITSPAALSKLLSDLEIKNSDHTMFFCQLDESEVKKEYGIYSGSVNDGVTYPEYAAGKYTGFRMECEKERARAVFVSLVGTSLANEKDFYATLKYSSGEGEAVSELPISIDDEKVHKGSLALWDFSDKHYSLGWISGGNYSCVTDYSKLFAAVDPKHGRVLRLTLNEDERTKELGVSGIALRNLPRTINMNGISTIDFTVSVDAESDVRLAFIVGTDDKRAEFFADSLQSGEIYTVSCDLSKYRYRDVTDYVGVVAYSSGNVVLDISKITVNSETLDDGEVRELFFPNENVSSESEGKSGVLIVSASFAILLSGVIFVLLLRHDKDEEESGKIVRGESLEEKREKRRVL